MGIRSQGFPFLCGSQSRAEPRMSRKKSVQVLLMSQYRRKVESSSRLSEEFKKKTLTALKSRSEDFSPQIRTRGEVGRKEIVKSMKYGAKANAAVRFG